MNLLQAICVNVVSNEYVICLSKKILLCVNKIVSVLISLPKLTVQFMLRTLEFVASYARDQAFQSPLKKNRDQALDTTEAEGEILEKMSWSSGQVCGLELLYPSVCIAPTFSGVPQLARL